MVDFKFIDAEELTSDLFKDIVIYAIAEPGAMGIPCLMDFVPKDGHCFSVFYKNKDTGEYYYDKIKEIFPAIDSCFWNGPMKNESNDGEIVLYPDSKGSNRPTQVPKDWKHIYLGFGNHVVIKREYFPIFDKINNDDYMDWELKQNLEKFINAINSEK